MNEPRNPSQGVPGNGHTYQPGIGQDYQLHAEREGGGSITGLLRQLTQEVTGLFTKEVALAKAEASDSINAAKAGVGAVATGGAVLMSGLIVLLFSAVYGLSNIVDPWLAALIVGAVVMLIGYAMVQSGKKKLNARSMRPDRTVHSMQKDKEVAKGRTV